MVKANPARKTGRAGPTVMRNGQMGTMADQAASARLAVIAAPIAASRTENQVANLVVDQVASHQVHAPTLPRHPRKNVRLIRTRHLRHLPVCSTAKMATSSPEAPSAGGATDRLRLDRWLFFSRLVKSRSLAAKLIDAGHVRVNGEKTQQAKHAVGPGDVLTVALPNDRAPDVKIIKLVACGTRRGPAAEAQTLYDDMTPPPLPKEDKKLAESQYAPSPGRRPTKHERQGLQRMKRPEMDED